MQTRTHLLTLLTMIACTILWGCGGGGGSGSSGGGSSTAVTGGTSPVSSSDDNNSNNNEATSTASTSGPDQPQVDTSTHVINTLILVSSGVGAGNADPQLRLTHLINVTNDVYAASAVPIRLHTVHTATVDYPDTVSAERALEALTQRSHEAFSGLSQLRDEHRADIVLLLRPYANDGHCGYAWMGGHNTNGDMSAFADFAYAVVASNCSDYVLAHEVGHLLGLSHSEREGDTAGTFTYGQGYGVDNDFTTVMASPAEFNAIQLPRLSSPDQTCNNQPCGSTSADAVRALQHTAPQVAGYLD